MPVWCVNVIAVLVYPCFYLLLATSLHRVSVASLVQLEIQHYSQTLDLATVLNLVNYLMPVCQRNSYAYLSCF